MHARPATAKPAAAASLGRQVQHQRQHPNPHQHQLARTPSRHARQLDRLFLSAKPVTLAPVRLVVRLVHPDRLVLAPCYAQPIQHCTTTTTTTTPRYAALKTCK